MKEITETPLTDREACMTAVLELIKTAERSVSIFSQQLEPNLYDKAEICSLLSTLARTHHQASIRLIAQNTKNAAHNGHCLIRLAQRLSSFVKIRTPNTDEIKKFSSSWLIIDNHSFFQLPNPERYEGTVIENSPNFVAQKLIYFDEAWEHSIPDTNTLRLHI